MTKAQKTIALYVGVLHVAREIRELNGVPTPERIARNLNNPPSYEEISQVLSDFPLWEKHWHNVVNI